MLSVMLESNDCFCSAFTFFLHSHAITSQVCICIIAALIRNKISKLVYSFFKVEVGS